MCFKYRIWRCRMAIFTAAPSFGPPTSGIDPVTNSGCSGVQTAPICARMSPRSAANSNWVPLGGRHEVACTQILAAAALCAAMDTRKTTTHMKAPHPGHLETSPSEAHGRGCGPVGLAGYKRGKFLNPPPRAVSFERSELTLPLRYYFGRFLEVRVSCLTLH